MSKQPEKKDYSARARTMINSNTSPNPAPKEKSTRMKGNLPPQKDRTMELVEAILFAIIAALFLKTFVVEAFHIPSGSMENTLLEGDFLLVNKFIYGAKSPMNIPFTDFRLPYFTLPAMRPPQRGDIVVFIFPGNHNELESPEVTNYIKRCVGTPGDTIVVSDKILSVNGKTFYTPPHMKYLDREPMKKGEMEPEPIFPPGAPWNHDNYGPLRIPARGDIITLTPANFNAWEMFIKREGHTPSLQKNIVYIDDKPADSYTVQRNYYFMMGDNRDRSEDSRYFGFVPEQNIVGQAMIIYLSWDQYLEFPKIISSIRWSRLFHWDLDNLNFKREFLDK